MDDDDLRQLAGRAGVATHWRDQAGQERVVAPDSLREILAALGFPAGSAADMKESLARAEDGEAAKAPLITARVGESVRLPRPAPQKIEATLESGESRAVALREDGALPAFDQPGYHKIHLPGGDLTIGVAPPRCLTFAEIKGGSGFGLAAQIYSLRSRDDGGIGNFGGVAALGRAAGAQGADLLAVSPFHALFGADPSRYSPYSPSTRLFYNPLYADPSLVLAAEIVGQAVDKSGVASEMARLSESKLIDWRAAAPVKLKYLRAVFDLLGGAPQAAEYATFREEASRPLIDHAIFELLHQELWRRQKLWRWRDWPAALRDPATAQVRAFAEKNAQEIDFQIFLQWLTTKSIAAAQKSCRDAGMKVGLIADLAIGTDADGSHAWSRPGDLLTSLSIGAPPDYYAAEGQNWGLAAFSPRGLRASGYFAFIETLRAALRHTGGLRIDHVMGMSRLWLIPEGRGALEGAYVDFPQDDLYRLIALESWRHRAMIIGEDLGTLPWGYREFLGSQGIYGMRALRFERNDSGFVPPHFWSHEAAALTTTHDMIATAGWWKGADIEAGPDEAEKQQERARDRRAFWRSCRDAGVVHGDQPSDWDAWPAVDAAISYVARTPCAVKIVAVEDILASEVQPNVPGTTVEKPNWRHRLDGDAARLLDDGKVRERLSLLR